jgi:hypothetical protein
MEAQRYYVDERFGYWVSIQLDAWTGRMVLGVFSCWLVMLNCWLSDNHTGATMSQDEFYKSHVPPTRTPAAPQAPVTPTAPPSQQKS